jgi:hypothetical protein
MKKLLLILITIMLVGGCTTLTLEEQKVVGTYDAGSDEYTNVLAVLENGVAEEHKRGKKVEQFNWKIIDGAIHLQSLKATDDFVQVLRINPDGSITGIEDIVDGKRKDMPKEDQLTFKKIK